MIKKIVCMLFVVSMICPSGSALAAGDAVAGKINYVICTACHGADGKGMPVMNAPNLTGLQESYIVRQLQDFRSGVRGTDPKDIYGMQCRPMAMTLTSDKAIEDVSAYIVTLGQ